MDEYDEFGNLIQTTTTANLPPSSPTSLDENDDDDEYNHHNGDDATHHHQQLDIIQPDDRNYFPDAHDVFGSDVEVKIFTDVETTPQLASTHRAIVENVTAPVTKPTRKPDVGITEFSSAVMNVPALCRTVCFIGHLHHGKTALLDGLLELSQAKPFPFSQPRPRAFDSRKDEKARGISIKSKPASMTCRDTMGKSWFFNVMDTPGHVNFMDEVAPGLRVCDGVVLVVCAVEGVQFGTERAIRLLPPNCPVIVVMNKVDRLIHELKLPPLDAYQKLKHVLDQINSLLVHAGVARVDPTHDPSRLVLASAEHGWCVTTLSMARLACVGANDDTAAIRLARRCWGDVFFDPDTRGFLSTKTVATQQRTFEKFVLEPLYKLYSHVLGSEPEALQALLLRERIRVTNHELKLDAKPLLKLVLHRALLGCSTLVDSIRDTCPSHVSAAYSRLHWPLAHSLGMDDVVVKQHLAACDPHGPLIAQAVKHVLAEDNDSDDDDDNNDEQFVEETRPSSLEARFRVFGRVMSGTLRANDVVEVFGEAFTVDEEPVRCRVGKLLMYQGGGRPSIPMAEIPAGHFFVMTGGGRLDALISRSSTIISAGTTDVPRQVLFSPMSYGDTKAIVKVAVEPLHASELPKMLSGLRAVQKSFPLCKTVVEDSGEHVIMGVGELYLDCLLHDLREKFAKGTEVKISDPTTTFTETVTDTSSMRCFAETQNGKNKFTMIASPLEPRLLNDLEHGHVTLQQDPSELETLLRRGYGYDILAARSVWAFGPNDPGACNALLDDTLEDDKTELMLVKDSVVQGFKWACRQGPLCDEPIRGVKFKLLDVALHPTPQHHGPGQVLPAVRKVAFASFLTAQPRLAEPLFLVNLLLFDGSIHPIIKAIVLKRRGRILNEITIPGTTFSRMQCMVPVLDSFGLETDLRVATRGRVSCEMIFARWETMEGDPMDESIQFRPLETSPVEWLARELVVKTRRKKGLSETVRLAEWFDPALLEEMARRDLMMNGEG